MPGIEPGASHMQSERSTAELHPPDKSGKRHGKLKINLNTLSWWSLDWTELNVI